MTVWTKLLAIQFLYILSGLSPTDSVIHSCVNSISSILLSTYR